MMAPKDGATEWAGNFETCKRCFCSWIWFSQRSLKYWMIFNDGSGWRKHALDFQYSSQFLGERCTILFGRNVAVLKQTWTTGAMAASVGWVLGKCWEVLSTMRDSYDDYLSNVFWIALVPRFGRWQEGIQEFSAIQSLQLQTWWWWSFSMRWSPRRCSQRSSGKSWRTWHGCTGGAMAWLDEQC